MLIMISRLGIALSLYTVVLGHILISVPFSMATLIPRFEGFDKSVEEAYADLGENAWWTFWRVTIPIVFPGVLASLLLCFTISFDEFIMAFFLTSTETTLPIFIYGQLRFPQKLPGVLASLLLCFTVSFDEFIMAFFLAGTEPTLPIYIWGQLRFPQKLPGVLALGSVILVFSFVVVFFSQWLRRRGVPIRTARGV